MKILSFAIGLILGFVSPAVLGGDKMMSAEDIIRKMDLKPLPGEGGYYRETYRSETYCVGQFEDLPATDSRRHNSTAIYYLVTPEGFSALHKVRSDEIFHFYAGDPVEMLQIDEAGNMITIIIGNDIVNGESPQVLAPKGVWQGTKLKSGGQWALMGTTVAPGFEFQDFEIGERNEMLAKFPHHRENIIRYTREQNQDAK